MHSADDDENDADGSSDIATTAAGSFGNVYLGSKQRPCTLGELISVPNHQSDLAFGRFRSKLNSFLTIFFQANGIELPNNKRINIALDAQVQLAFWR